MNRAVLSATSRMAAFASYGLRCSSAVRGAPGARADQASSGLAGEKYSTAGMHTQALSVNPRIASLPPCPFVQYKERVRPELIKPAVDWKKSGVSVATMSAAVAK